MKPRMEQMQCHGEDLSWMQSPWDIDELEETQPDTVITVKGMGWWLMWAYPKQRWYKVGQKSWCTDCLDCGKAIRGVNWDLHQTKCDVKKMKMRRMHNLTIYCKFCKFEHENEFNDRNECKAEQKYLDMLDDWNRQHPTWVMRNYQFKQIREKALQLAWETTHEEATSVEKPIAESNKGRKMFEKMEKVHGESKVEFTPLIPEQKKAFEGAIRTEGVIDLEQLKKGYQNLVRGETIRNEVEEMIIEVPKKKKRVHKRKTGTSKQEEKIPEAIDAIVEMESAVQMICRVDEEICEEIPEVIEEFATESIVEPLCKVQALEAKVEEAPFEEHQAQVVQWIMEKAQVKYPEFRAQMVQEISEVALVEETRKPKVQRGDKNFRRKTNILARHIVDDVLTQSIEVVEKEEQVTEALQKMLIEQASRESSPEKRKKTRRGKRKPKGQMLSPEKRDEGEVKIELQIPDRAKDVHEARVEKLRRRGALHYFKTHAGRRELARASSLPDFPVMRYDEIFPYETCESAPLNKSVRRCPYRCDFFFQTCDWHEGLLDAELMRNRQILAEEYRSERLKPAFWKSIKELEGKDIPHSQAIPWSAKQKMGEIMETIETTVMDMMQSVVAMVTGIVDAERRWPQWARELRRVIYNFVLQLINVIVVPCKTTILTAVGVIVGELYSMSTNLSRGLVDRFKDSLTGILAGLLPRTRAQAQPTVADDMRAYNEGFATSLMGIIASWIPWVKVDPGLLKARMQKIELSARTLGVMDSIGEWFGRVLKKLKYWFHIYWYGMTPEEAAMLDETIDKKVLRWMENVTIFEASMENGAAHSGLATLASNKQHQEKVIRWQQEGAEFERKLAVSNDPSVRNLLQSVRSANQKLSKWGTIFQGSLTPRTDKHTPFVVYLWGPPKCGKTFMVDYIAGALCRVLGHTYDPRQDKYSKPRDSEYWQNYTGQKVHVVDDFLQIKTPDTIPAMDYSMLIDIGSRNPMPLNRADVESKGCVYYSSPICILTSNVRPETHQAESFIADYDAFARRLSAVVEVHKVREPRTVDRFDRDAINFSTSRWTCTTMVKYHWESSRIMNWDDFIVNLCRRFKRHCDRENALDNATLLTNEEAEMIDHAIAVDEKVQEIKQMPGYALPRAQVGNQNSQYPEPGAVELQGLDEEIFCICCGELMTRRKQPAHKCEYVHLPKPTIWPVNSPPDIDYGKLMCYRRTLTRRVYGNEVARKSFLNNNQEVAEALYAYYETHGWWNYCLICRRNFSCQIDWFRHLMSYSGLVDGSARDHIDHGRKLRDIPFGWDPCMLGQEKGVQLVEIDEDPDDYPMHSPWTYRELAYWPDGLKIARSYTKPSILKRFYRALQNYSTGYDTIDNPQPSRYTCLKQSFVRTCEKVKDLVRRLKVDKILLVAGLVATGLFTVVTLMRKLSKWATKSSVSQPVVSTPRECVQVPLDAMTEAFGSGDPTSARAKRRRLRIEVDGVSIPLEPSRLARTDGGQSSVFYSGDVMQLPNDKIGWVRRKAGADVHLVKGDKTVEVTFCATQKKIKVDPDPEIVADQILGQLEEDGVIAPLLDPKQKRSILVQELLENGPRVQAARDTNLFNILSVLSSSVAQVQVQDIPGVVKGVFVADRVVMFPYHVFRMSGHQGRVLVIKTKNIQDLVLKMDDVRTYIDTNKDLCFVQVPPQMIPLRRDITKLFIEENEVDFSKDSGYLFVPDLELSEKVLTAATWKAVSDIQVKGHLEYEGDSASERYFITSAVTYHGDSVSGDCGSLLVRIDPKRDRKLLGVHVAGDVGIGYSTLVTRSYLEGVLQNFVTAVRQSYVPDIGEAEGTKEFFSEWTPQEVLGVLEKTQAPVRNLRTSLRKSKLYSKLIEPLTCPSQLAPFTNGEGVRNDPLSLGLRKLDVPQILLPQSIVEMVVQRMRLEYAKLKLNEDFGKCGLLTWSETLNGVEGSNWMKPMNMATSPGYPYVLAGGKKRYVIQDAEGKYSMGEQLMTAVVNREQEIINGWWLPAICYDVLKDERRPIEKVQAGKTRIFTCCPFDVNILMRKYFLKFLAHLMSHHLDGEVSVGINVHGDGWRILWNRLRAAGKYWVAGDYGAWDKRTPYQLAIQCLQIVEDFYKRFEDYKPEHQKIREVLVSEMFSSVRIASGKEPILYRVYQSMPSGIPLTAVYNSVINSALFRVIYVLIGQEHGIVRRDLVNNYDSNVSFVAYGDDHLVRVAPGVEWFNLRNIAEMMARYGIEYTMPWKGEVNQDWIADEQVTYLKRRFVQRGACVDAPLPLEQVLDISNWVHAEDEKSGVDALESALDSIMIELTHHGKEVWTEWKRKIFEVCVQESLICPIVGTFEEEVARRQSNDTWANMLS